jgi:hypothetical protein
MRRTPLSVPEIALISGTRAAAGAGLGLLIADRLTPDIRRAVGWTLLGLGVITTVPIVVQLISSFGDADDDDAPDSRDRDLRFSRRGVASDGLRGLRRILARRRVAMH